MLQNPSDSSTRWSNTQVVIKKQKWEIACKAIIKEERNEYKFNSVCQEESLTLTRSDDDVVDRDEDELHEEANEPHDHEPDSRTDRHLCELCCIQIEKRKSHGKD